MRRVLYAVILLWMPMVLQAEVKLYGRVNVSADYLDNGKEGGSIYVASNSSRLGVKGSVPAGSNMKALFQYEVTVQGVDHPDKTFSARNSFIGLSTSVGTVLMGRHDTPFKKLGRKMDLFGNRLGDSRNIIGLKKGKGWDLRLPNTLIYASPSVLGVTTTVAYIAEDGGDGTDAISGSVMYKSGGILAGAAYEIHSQGLLDDSEGKDKESAFRIGGSYKAGPMRVAVLWHNVMSDGGVKDKNRASYGIGGAYKVMQNTFVKAQFYLAQEQDDGKDNSTVWVIGVEQKLSKKVSAYIDIAGSTNGEKGKVNIAGGGHNNTKNFKGASGESALGAAIGGVIKF